MKYIPMAGALATVLCLCFSASAEDKTAEAARHFKKGVELFNENRKEEAVQEFTIAYETKPSWKIMYNIGQCHASLKRYGLAIESFERYLGQGGDEVPNDRQDAVLSELDRLRKMVGSVKVHGPDGVEIYIDKILRGTTPMASSILATAGVEHQIWLIKDGKKLLSVAETVSGTEVLELTVPTDDAGTPEAVGPLPPGGETVAEPPPPVPDPNAEAATEASTADTTGNADGAETKPEEAAVPPPADTKGGLNKAVFIATAAATVVFGGVAGGMAFAVNKKWESSVDKINDSPWDTDTEAVAANIHTMQLIGYVSLGLAAAGLITAVTVIPFTDWKGAKSRKTAAVTAGPWADRSGGGLVLKGRF